MLRTSVLVLAIFLMAGCGGGTIPFSPIHSGSGTGSSSGTSTSGSSGTSTSGSGTSTSGSSGATSGSGTVAGPNQFSMWGYDWTSSQGNAPGGTSFGTVGTLDPQQVSVGSDLVLTLTQTSQNGTIYSVGAEVYTNQTFTYGTFEFTSRVANVASGSTASGFIYARDSITEIDMEQVGNKPDAVDCTNWQGTSNFQDTQVFGFDQGNTHDFKIVWRSDHVDWYVDGQKIVSHTQAVPSSPAHFIFNLWGTNKSTWGGLASPDVTRYMYISNFKYTP